MVGLEELRPKLVSTWTCPGCGEVAWGCAEQRAFWQSMHRCRGAVGMRKGEEVVIDGVAAWYAPHELKALRSMVHAAGLTPVASWPAIALVHALKFQLEATIVDDVEEASIRRGWVAAEPADNSAGEQASAA